MKIDYNQKPVFDNFEVENTVEFRTLNFMENAIQVMMEMTDAMFKIKEQMVDRVRSGDVQSLEHLFNDYTTEFCDVIDAYDTNMDMILDACQDSSEPDAEDDEE